MICDSWKDCGVRQGGCCQLGLYGGRPSLGVCAKCDQRTVDGVKPEKSQFELIKKYARVEITQVMQGFASEADAAARLAICMTCPDRAVEHKGVTDSGGIGYCTKCGCGNNPRALLTVKVTLSGVECPLLKWGKVPGTGATLASAVDAVAGVTQSIIHKLTGG